MENAKTLEEIGKTEKCITSSSFGMDINTLKAPMFIYNNYKPVKDIEGNIVNKIEERTYEWKDSKNINRKLYMYCKGRLPRQFESDVLFALMGMFIKKNAPFPYNDSEKIYEINVSKVDFSWYELAEFLNVQPTGYYIDRMKEAVRILKQTQYFSYDNGVLYDKRFGKYVQSGEEGISLISKYKFKTVKKLVDSDEYSTEINKNYVTFDELILNNLRYEYFKYLNINLYFNKIPSGIGRGIYGYLEANRYDGLGNSLKYIKRFNETLKFGIPVDFTYPYELKRRLKKPLEHLKKIGYLKDYTLGDEIMINGEKEDCVYFCFDITKEELKRILEKKKEQQLQLKLNIVSKCDSEIIESKYENYLKLPSRSLQEELIDKGFDEFDANKIIKSYDKWDIIKYLIWVHKQLLDGSKIGNIAGLIRFALTQNIGISSGYQEIVDFIENQKKEGKQKREEREMSIESKYENYIDKEIERFKEEENEVYEMFLSAILKNIEENIDNRYNQVKAMGGETNKLDEFKEKKTDSSWFKEMFRKEVTIYRKLKNLEEFRINDVTENK